MAGTTILIVDDEAEIQLVLKQILNLKNYETESVSTGKEALERLAKKAFGLVLLDLSLPDIPGLELARRIGDATAGRVPVLVVSGNPDLASMALPPGVVGVAGKPFDFKELLRTIGQYCPPPIAARPPEASL